MRMLLCALQIATATLVIKSSSMPLPPRSGHRHLYLAATLLGLLPLSITSMTTTTSTSATLASKGYHLHVVLTGFYLQLILQSQRMWCSGALLEDVRVYLIGYILCLIDYHICQDIFSRIAIMYYRLPYVFRCSLPLKTLVLYIYRPRDTI
jgi:hypothetical protein